MLNCGKQEKMEGIRGNKAMVKNGRRSNRERKMALIQDVFEIFNLPQKNEIFCCYSFHLQNSHVFKAWLV